MKEARFIRQLKNHLPVLEVGTGKWGRIELRPGFDLFISDFRVKESSVCHAKSSQPGFGFGFWLSGETFGSGEHIPAQLYNAQGTAPLLFSPSEQSGFIREERDSHRRSIVLAIEPDMLHFLLRGMLDNLPREYRMLLDGATPGYSAATALLPQQCTGLLRTCIIALLQVLPAVFFWKARQLELMALRLDQAMALEKEKQKPWQLCSEDIERIRFAARQLCADLIHPPSLFELSASAEMSHAKLTTGFKQVFTATPFEYLRQTRLNQARMLLETRQSNVTEFAYALAIIPCPPLPAPFAFNLGIAPMNARQRKTVPEAVPISLPFNFGLKKNLD